jgi:hypothetical protein
MPKKKRNTAAAAAKAQQKDLKEIQDAMKSSVVSSRATTPQPDELSPPLDSIDKGKGIAIDALADTISSNLRGNEKKDDGLLRDVLGNMLGAATPGVGVTVTPLSPTTSAGASQGGDSRGGSLAESSNSRSLRSSVAESSARGSPGGAAPSAKGSLVEMPPPPLPQQPIAVHTTSASTADGAEIASKDFAPNSTTPNNPRTSREETRKQSEAALYLRESHKDTPRALRSSAPTPTTPLTPFTPQSADTLPQTPSPLPKPAHEPTALQPAGGIEPGTPAWEMAIKLVDNDQTANPAAQAHEQDGRSGIVNQKTDTYPAAVFVPANGLDRHGLAPDEQLIQHPSRPYPPDLHQIQVQAQTQAQAQTPARARPPGYEPPAASDNKSHRGADADAVHPAETVAEALQDVDLEGGELVLAQRGVVGWGGRMARGCKVVGWVVALFLTVGIAGVWMGFPV